MASSAPKEKFLWVRHIGRLWVLQLRFAQEVTTPMGAVVLLAGVSFKMEALIIAGLALLGLSLVLFLAMNYSLYRLVVCPECGHNPMRVKSSGKRLNYRLTRARLRDLAECPECGK